MTEQKLSKKQKTFNIIIAAVILIPIIMMTITIIKSKNQMINDLTELNSQREAAFIKIRPLLIQYKKDHNAFPDQLNKLVPEYTMSIPAILNTRNQSTNDYASNDMSMEYISDGKTAAFHFRRGYAHTPVIIYDILSNSYSQKEEPTETENNSGKNDHE